MTTTVEFLYDFGSPNAYLCHRAIPALEARTGVSVQYVPILLGGLFKLSNNQSPAVTTADIPNKRAYDMLEIRRFVGKHGISAFQFNPFFPMNTLSLMRAAVAAEKLGCSVQYVEAMFVAMWEQGRNMNDASDVVAALKHAGLDAQALLEGAQAPDVKAQLLANTEHAFARGAFGSPTFFVGQEMYFGKDRMHDVELEITNRNDASQVRNT